MKIFTLSLSLLLLSFTSHAQVFDDHVVHVIDGDTFKTETGRTVRIIGINTPEIDFKGNHSQPFAQKARKKLTSMIHNKTIQLETHPNLEKDKFGRTLAFVHQNGKPVAHTLLSDGLAHVYTFEDTPFDATTYYMAEESARKNNLGIWKTNRWQVYTTPESIPKKAIGRFNLYQGKIIKSTRVQDRVYLNFGHNWRTDFTIEIRKKDEQHFTVQGINLEKDYLNKSVRVRGFFKPINGVLVTASHPNQIEILTN